MEYKRSSRSGVLLPRISLGPWQNFGLEEPLEEQKDILFRASDMGIIHLDLVNNYGRPTGGMAEENFGAILKSDLGRYRDELFISTKTGYDFWPGPYGNWGSRRCLMAGLDSSLKRMGLDYVDVFHHHRPDPETPLEEIMDALSDAVRQGKALYVAISNYRAPEAEKAVAMPRVNGTPCLLHQPCYNMLKRWVEDGLLKLLNREGVGCICLSPLAQEALTNKCPPGVPEGPRVSRKGNTIGGRYLSEESLVKIRGPNQIAVSRGQTLAQMVLVWVLRRSEVTSVLIGAGSTARLENNVTALGHLAFEPDELEKIESVLSRQRGCIYIQRWNDKMMGKLNYEVGDAVKLRKSYPRGSNEWEILRMGADFRPKCMGCGHQIMVVRRLVEKDTRGSTKKGANPQELQ